MAEYGHLAAPVLLNGDASGNDGSFAESSGSLTSTPSSSADGSFWSSSSASVVSPSSTSGRLRRCQEASKELNRLKYRQQVARMLQQASERLGHAETQLRVVARQMEHEKIRFERACSRAQRSFRYTLRLRLAVLEGMLNMMREYATARATERQKLISLLRHADSEIGLPACRFDDTR